MSRSGVTEIVLTESFPKLHTRNYTAFADYLNTIYWQGFHLTPAEPSPRRFFFAIRGQRHVLINFLQLVREEIHGILRTDACIYSVDIRCSSGKSSISTLQLAR